MLQNACAKAYDRRFNARLCLGNGEGRVAEDAHDGLRRDTLDGCERPYDARRKGRIRS